MKVCETDHSTTTETKIKIPHPPILVLVVNLVLLVALVVCVKLGPVAVGVLIAARLGLEIVGRVAKKVLPPSPSIQGVATWDSIHHGEAVLVYESKEMKKALCKSFFVYPTKGEKLFVLDGQIGFRFGLPLHQYKVLNASGLMFWVDGVYLTAA